MDNNPMNPGSPSGQNPFSSFSGPKPENRPPAVPPPPAKVDVRTMGSDIKSIGRGDAMPIPESVMAPESSKELLMGPDTENQLPPGQVSGGSSGKKAALWIGAIGGVIVLGLVGYFVVYPLLFPAVPPSPPPAPPAPPVSALPHESLFVIPADAQAKIRLADVSLFSISDELATVAEAGLESGKIQEVAIADGGDSQVPAAAYFETFNLGVSGENLATWFEDDFTAFVYYDGNGEWPGYVLKMKSGVAPSVVQTGLQAIESADLSSLYLDPVGAAGEFKDGQVNSNPSRYAVFTDRPGAALNYLVANGFTIIATSYDAAKKAATLLGF